MVAQLDARYIRIRPWKLWPRLLAYAAFEGRPLTTRGRWINPFVLAWLRCCAALPISGPVHSPIMITGVGRSGTTILGKVLGLHRDCGFLNEPKALWHVALGDEDVIGSYAAADGRFRFGSGDASNVAISRLRRCYRSFAILSGSSRVVDKYPELIFRTKLLDAAFADSHMIVLIRDGWQTAASIQNWSDKNGCASADWWGKDQRKWRLLIDELVRPDPFFGKALPAILETDDQANMAAVEWVVTMREAIALQHSGRNNVHIIRYEDLAEAPAAYLAKLMDDCGLDWDSKVIKYASRAIRRGKSHPRPKLSPEIADLVSQTMRSLGYREGPN